MATPIVSAGPAKPDPSPSRTMSVNRIPKGMSQFSISTNPAMSTSRANSTGSKVLIDPTMAVKRVPKTGKSKFSISTKPGMGISRVPRSTSTAVKSEVAKTTATNTKTDSNPSMALSNTATTPDAVFPKPVTPQIEQELQNPPPTQHDHQHPDHSHHDHPQHEHQADPELCPTGLCEFPPPPPGGWPSMRPLCPCGPNIPSLFEMARLRKEAKLRKQQQLKEQQNRY